MRFSLVMPAHNAADRISKALDSVKNQHFKDYEIIVICDACEDNTEEIAKQYGAITKCIDAHSDGAARNAGIELAQGEYLLFQDDDDWWLHEFAFGQIDEQLRKLGHPDVLAFSFIWKTWMYAKPRSNTGGTYWTAVWNKAWRRTFVKDIKFRHIPRKSDMHWTQDVLAKNPKICDWNMPLYYYNFVPKEKKNDTKGTST